MIKSFIYISLFFFFSLINFSHAAKAINGNLFNDEGSVKLHRSGQVIHVPKGKSEITGSGDIIQTGDESLAHLYFPLEALFFTGIKQRSRLKPSQQRCDKNRFIFKLLRGNYSVFVNKITREKGQGYESKPLLR
jgi:hypothetical protein